MNSIAYPDMFSGSYTNLIEDADATLSNLKLLLASYKTQLFGDPFFGTSIELFTYVNYNTVVRDLIIDDIYNAIGAFMPQISIKRSDIKVEFVSKHQVNVYISCINKKNGVSNTYYLNLFSDEDDTTL